MKKGIAKIIIVALLFNYAEAQTIPQRNFVEAFDGIYDGLPGITAQNNFALYLNKNTSNVGVQYKIMYMDPDDSVWHKELASPYLDSFDSTWGNWYPKSIHYSPNWICKRDSSTYDNFSISGDKYCQSTGIYTYYSTRGYLYKVNDSIFDVISMFLSQRNETGTKFLLHVYVVEDSIYYRQPGSPNNIYHRNVMVGYVTKPPVLPSTIVANQKYYFYNRLKIKPFSSDKQFSVIVVAYDIANGKYLNSSNSKKDINYIPEICIASVDSLNRCNIIWNPTEINGKVYLEKETNVTNKYLIVDSAFSSKPRILIDSKSDAAIKSEAYRLRLLDTTKLPGYKPILSGFGKPHRTIHLSINKGTGNNWNLIWSSYEGFSVVSYDIYRRFGTSTWSKIASVSGNVNSYTDVNVSGSNVAYKVSVIAPSACDPNAWAIFSSESNVADQNSSRAIVLRREDLSVYPNPTDQKLSIVSNVRSGLMKSYEIRDVSGRIICRGLMNCMQKELDVSPLKQGTYVIAVFFENGVLDKKLIKL